LVFKSEVMIDLRYPVVTTTIVFLTAFLGFGNHRIYIFKRFLIHLVTFKSFICFWFFGRFQFNKNNCFGFLNKNAESRSVFRNNRWRCGVEKSKFACALFEQWLQYLNVQMTFSIYTLVPNFKKHPNIYPPFDT